MKENERLMLRALALAQELHPEVRNWIALAHLVGQSPQTIWNWRKRGLPPGAVVTLADKIGCSVEMLRNVQAPVKDQDQIEDADMTPEESTVIAHYRRANQSQREATKLVLGVPRPHAAPPPSTAPSDRVVPLRKKKR